MRRLLALLVLGCALLAGCTTEVDPSAPNNSNNTPDIIEPAPLTVPAVGELSIPDLNVRSSLVPVGKDEEGNLEVPPVTQPEQAAWYKLGPTPGETGPAIIVGHVNGSGRPGVFANLDKMQNGQVISVGNDTFEIYDKVQVKKDGEFPTDRVFARTDGPELRLITCFGNFIGGDVGYEDNVIVFARKR